LVFVWHRLTYCIIVSFGFLCQCSLPPVPTTGCFVATPGITTAARRTRPLASIFRMWCATVQRAPTVLRTRLHRSRPFPAPRPEFTAPKVQCPRRGSPAQRETSAHRGSSPRARRESSPQPPGKCPMQRAPNARQGATALRARHPRSSASQESSPHPPAKPLRPPALSVMRGATALMDLRPGFCVRLGGSLRSQARHSQRLAPHAGLGFTVLKAR
jgi:hypothetical protein